MSIMSYFRPETTINKSEGFSSDPAGHSQQIPAQRTLHELLKGGASGTESWSILMMLKFNLVQSSHLINEEIGRNEAWL